MVVYSFISVEGAEGRASPEDVEILLSDDMLILSKGVRDEESAVRAVRQMGWVENYLPAKIYRYNLRKNPKVAFYLFLMLCVSVTIVLGTLAYLAIQSPKASLGVKVFGLIMMVWVLFLGYWGAWVCYVGDYHQAHKIKWEDGKVYLWNRYMNKILVYSLDDIDDIVFSRNGLPLRDGRGEPTEMILMIRTGIPMVPSKIGVALGMEIGLKLKEDWEKWKGQKRIMKI